MTHKTQTTNIVVVQFKFFVVNLETIVRILYTLTRIKIIF